MQDNKGLSVCLSVWLCSWQFEAIFSFCFVFRREPCVNIRRAEKSALVQSLLDTLQEMHQHNMPDEFVRIVVIFLSSCVSDCSYICLVCVCLCFILLFLLF